jgi:hypothetical protein
VEQAEVNAPWSHTGRPHKEEIITKMTKLYLAGFHEGHKFDVTLAVKSAFVNHPD